MTFEERAVAEDAAREAGTFSGGAFLLRHGLAYAYANANANADVDANANAYADANAAADADADAYAYADADADANANAYADADANANAYAAAAADADANANADAYAYADADADANANVDAGQLFISAFSGGEHVRNGFYFWAQPNGGVVVLRLGWLRRVNGDEYEVLNQVTPLRNGDYKTLFADLAIDGPPKGWKFSRPIPGACPANRFHILGPVPLKPDQWSKISPRPEGWDE